MRPSRAMRTVVLACAALALATLPAPAHAATRKKQVDESGFSVSKLMSSAVSDYIAANFGSFEINGLMRLSSTPLCAHGLGLDSFLQCELELHGDKAIRRLLATSVPLDIVLRLRAASAAELAQAGSAALSANECAALFEHPELPDAQCLAQFLPPRAMDHALQAVYSGFAWPNVSVCQAIIDRALYWAPEVTDEFWALKIAGVPNIGTFLSAEQVAAIDGTQFLMAKVDILAEIARRELAGLQLVRARCEDLSPGVTQSATCVSEARRIIDVLWGPRKGMNPGIKLVVGFFGTVGTIFVVNYYTRGPGAKRKAD